MGKISSCTNIQKQRAIIKFRLKELVNQHYPNGYAVSELRRKLSEPQYGGFEFADNTIKRTLDCSRDNQSLDLYLGTKNLTIGDLADTTLIDPKTFGLICNGMAIRRYGVGAVKFKERTDKA